MTNEMKYEKHINNKSSKLFKKIKLITIYEINLLGNKQSLFLLE
jgi:hypothetical protein